jgi:AAA+ superfamily predicted ATPase
MNIEDFHDLADSPGLTITSVIAFLQKEFPSIPRWTVWHAQGKPYAVGLSQLGGKEDRGCAGPWKWERVRTGYPSPYFWSGALPHEPLSSQWIGCLRITGPHAEEFLVFSYLAKEAGIGVYYCASTDDTQLLMRFATGVTQAFAPKDRIMIHSVCGDDETISATECEHLVLDTPMSLDIQQQVQSHLDNGDMYRQLGVPRRRGFLFVGPPGTGKTMMIRKLVRDSYAKRPELTFWRMDTTRHTDDFTVARCFHLAQQAAPSFIILEDLDSLTRETSVTRAGLLSQLDGLAPKENILVLGTTNNPAQVDPALLHRPSRFDRVWKFDLPDQALRLQYLQWAFDGMSHSVLQEVSSKTHGWSFAYLNELRISARILAIDNNRTSTAADDVHGAFNLLNRQFGACRRGHEDSAGRGNMGFKSAP